MIDDDQLADVLREVAVWGMTLLLFHEYLEIAERSGVRRNCHYSDRLLTTPATQTAGPNVETIYGFGWIDLNGGPQVLEVPDTSDRYYCLQMLDACLQNIRYIGRRTTGTAARTFLLTGPDWTGEVPETMTQVEFPTNLVLSLPRMQVRDAADPADVAEAGRLMEGIVLGSLAEYPGSRIPCVLEDNATGDRFPAVDLAGMGANYFDRLCDVLTTQPPPRAELVEVMRFAKIGIGPGERPSTDADLAPLLDDALRAAIAEVRGVQPMRLLGDGPWMTSTPIRDVGPVEPKLRARMNIDAPGFQAAVEAVYAAAVTAADGSGLSGEKSYRLVFPPCGVPPVDAFWSMTMYAMPGMRLAENPINRYAIGSNFEDLEYGEDGSLAIQLQRQQPDGSTANWLPTPAEGPFMLLCRLYQPTNDVIDGNYSMPPVEEI